MEQLQTLPMTVQKGAESLDDLLFDPDDYFCDESFVVDTLDKATWATSKYLAAERRMRDRKLLADTYIDRITAWLDRANKGDLATQAFMETLLDPFVRQYLEGQKRGKSFKVLGARLGIRKGFDQLNIEDLDAAVAYCQENLPDALIVRKDISKAIAKSYLADGFEIPGLSMTEGSERLAIKEDSPNEQE